MGSYSSGTQSTSTKVAVFRHTVATGETSVTVPFTGKFAKAAALTVYRGVSAGNPVDVVTSGSTTSGTSVTAPSLTPSTPGEQLLMITGATGAVAGSTWSAPPTMSLRVQQAGGTSTSSVIADQARPTGDATGSRTATVTTPAALVGVLLALNPSRTTYGYDARGNRTSIVLPSGSTTSLVYDQANRLKSYGSSTYVYNGDGDRTSKTVGATTTSFVYDTPGGPPARSWERSHTTRSGRPWPPPGRQRRPCWAGDYRDAESGFVFLRARSYDPSNGPVPHPRPA